MAICGDGGLRILVDSCPSSSWRLSLGGATANGTDGNALEIGPGIGLSGVGSCKGERGAGVGLVAGHGPSLVTLGGTSIGLRRQPCSKGGNEGAARELGIS